MATEITLIKSAIAQIRGDEVEVGCIQRKYHYFCPFDTSLLKGEYKLRIHNDSSISLSQGRLVCLDMLQVI